MENMYHVQNAHDIKTKALLVQGLAEVVEHGDDLLSDPESSEDEASDAESEIRSFRSDDDLLSALDSFTTSLMDIRPVLEESLRDLSRPPTRKAGIPLPNFQVTESARPYVLQVHDKFREADSALVERLGEANWQRYMRIKAVMAANVSSDNPLDTTFGHIAREVPKSTFRPVSLFHDSGLGTSLPNRSQYAASNASHTSFLSTDTDATKGRARVTSTPMEVSEGKPFVCFICTHTLSGIRNRVDWKMHVFADLHPYICTFPQCPDALITYPTRKLWAEHELKTHRSQEQYECHDCSRSFSVEAEFVAHVDTDHGFKDLNLTQRLATVSAAKKSVFSPTDDQECPLCQRTGWKLLRNLTMHLAKHLEDIALSSLPRNDDSDSDSDKDSVSESIPKIKSQLTSYWSVREQKKFPNLINYFGRDFAAIADFMKTKSMTMVKNFYTCEITGGNKGLEDAAHNADKRRLRGESLGPPPSPIQSVKQKKLPTPISATKHVFQDPVDHDKEDEEIPSPERSPSPAASGSKKYPKRRGTQAISTPRLTSSAPQEILRSEGYQEQPVQAAPVSLGDGSSSLPGPPDGLVTPSQVVKKKKLSLADYKNRRSRIMSTSGVEKSKTTFVEEKATPERVTPLEERSASSGSAFMIKPSELIKEEALATGGIEGSAVEDMPIKDEPPPEVHNS
jgi:hypothetical protein